MKILIFLRKWEGGVGVVINSIKKELEKKGNEIICISRENDLKSFSSIKNLFWLRKEYKKIIKKVNPDIIYTQDWSMAIPLVFPSKIFKEKHFCCFHGDQPGKSSILQKIIGNLMGNKLIVVGDSLKNKFKKSNLVYNGIDLGYFKPNKKVKRITNSVGFVNWKTPEYHYKEIKEACEKEGKRFIVAENIPYEEMPKFYQKIESFISLPPKCTGFNMSWIEAMACGVPRIMGNDAGIGKKLKIDKIKKDEEVRNLIARAKKREYRKEIEKTGFTWEENARRLTKIFKNDLQKNKKRI